MNLSTVSLYTPRSLLTMTKFALATSVLLLLASTSSEAAFAPATTGSSFVQTRALVNHVPPQQQQQPTSTSLQMNLFDRFARVAKANVNNILKTLEDPEKIMSQAVEDMQVRLPAVNADMVEHDCTCWLLTCFFFSLFRVIW